MLLSAIDEKIDSFWLCKIHRLKLAIKGLFNRRSSELDQHFPVAHILSSKCGRQCGKNTFEVAELIMQKRFVISPPSPDKAEHYDIGCAEQGQFTVQSQL